MNKNIEIQTEIGNFLFYPNFIIKDELNNPFLYIRFYRKEKLILFHATEHSESEQAIEKIKTIPGIFKRYGEVEGWLISEVKDYVNKIQNKTKLQNLELIQK